MTEEKRVAALLTESYPASPAPSSLRERVEAQATRHRQESQARTHKRLQNRRMRLRFGALAAVLLLCLGGMVAWPRWVAARVLQQMETAILDVRNAHTVTWEIAAGGRRTKRSETWFQGSAVRSEETDLTTDPPRPESVQLYTRGKYWTYRPESSRVTVRRQNGFAWFNASGFSIASMRRDIARWGWKDQIRVLGETVIDGRPTRRVSIEREEPAGETRQIILVDSQTDLPYKMELQLKTRAGWTTRMLAEMRYNEPLNAARLFQPDFPRTAKWVDEDAVRATLRERLAAGIARRKVSGGRRIVLRDFQVNDEGDVFLLYTAGKAPGDAFAAGLRWAGRDWEVTVADDLGNRYVNHGEPLLMSTFLPGTDAARTRVCQGERLEGDAWTPEGRQKTPWKPRRFTVTFRVDPRNLHGQSETDMGRAQLSESVTFVLPVKAPQISLVPDYASALLLDLDEKTLREAQANVRGELPPGVLPSPELTATLGGNKDSVHDLAFSPDGQRLASAAWDSGIRLWNVASGREMGAWSIGSSPNGDSVAFSPDGRYLAMSGSTYRKGQPRLLAVQLRDARTGASLWQAEPPAKDHDWLRGIRFSTDGKTVLVPRINAEQVTPTADGPMIVSMSAQLIAWDAESGKPRTPGPRFASQPSFQAEMTTQNEWIISRYSVTESRAAGNGLQIWSGERQSLIREIKPPDGFTIDLTAMSGDGIKVVAAGRAKRGRPQTLVWEKASGRLLQTLETDIGSGWAHTNTVAVSREGDLVAVAGSDKKIFVWNARSGNLLTTLVGHGSQVMKVTFSPDGALIASGDLRGVVKLWRLPPEVE